MAYKILKEDLDKNLKNDLEKWASVFSNNDPFPYSSAGCTYKEFLIKEYENNLTRLKETTSKVDSLNSKYYWIGINPYKLGKEIPMKEMYDKMLKFIDRTWCANVMFNIETHTKEGYRLHSHMIVKTNVKKFRIIDQLSRFFNCKENFIDVENYAYGYNERVQYIKGIKTESKNQFVEKDQEQRIEEGIPQYFSNIV